MPLTSYLLMSQMLVRLLHWRQMPYSFIWRQWSIGTSMKYTQSSIWRHKLIEKCSEDNFLAFNHSTSIIVVYYSYTLERPGITRLHLCPNLKTHPTPGLFLKRHRIFTVRKWRQSVWKCRRLSCCKNDIIVLKIGGWRSLIKSQFDRNNIL